MNLREHACRIVVTDDFPPFFQGPEDEDLARLRGVGEVAVHGTRSGDRGEFIARVAGAGALVYLRRPAPLDAGAFAALPGLRVVSFPGVGGDSIDLAAAARHGVTVCNLPGANAVAVAEHAMGLVFAVVRSIPFADRSMRAGRWRKREGFELQGRALGLLGLGSVGRQMARLGRGIGMDVIAWSFRHDPERAAAAGVELVEFDELFRRADVVSVHLRGSPESKGIVGAREIGLMKAGAVLVNTARAAIVDEEGLAAALRSGRLAGAGIDVHDPEPLPAELNRFRDLDSVVMTPHMADETVETNARLRRGVVDNVIAFLEGRPRNVMAASSSG